jgi:hypothetical protein
MGLVLATILEMPAYEPPQLQKLRLCMLRKLPQQVQRGFLPGQLCRVPIGHSHYSRIIDPTAIGCNEHYCQKGRDIPSIKALLLAIVENQAPTPGEDDIKVAYRDYLLTRHGYKTNKL